MGKLKGTLTGAAGGAATGSAFGPWGTAIGGVIGGTLGYFGSDDDDESPAQQAVVDSRNQLEEMRRQQRGQRQQDLTRALEYFGPVNARLKQMYGVDFPRPYGTMPAGATTARRGVGHFGAMGAAPPPPPPPGYGLAPLPAPLPALTQDNGADRRGGRVAGSGGGAGKVYFR